MTAARGLPMRATIGVLLLLSLTACSEDSTHDPLETSASEPTTAARVLVTSDLVTLHVGETASIRLAAAADQAANRRWATDDPAIADVDMAGTITGKETGSTTVTVTAGDRTTDILVTVLPVSTKSAVKAAQK